jgi:hypothetical protein
MINLKPKLGCWIAPRYRVERILAEYLLFWISAFTSIVLYLLLFLFFRGNIRVDPHHWTKIKFTTSTRGPSGQEDWSTRTVDHNQALKMLCCTSSLFDSHYLGMTDWQRNLDPLAYTIIIGPLSIARWSNSGSIMPRSAVTTPFVVLGIGYLIFGLSGIVNVILFVWTRPSILLFGLSGGPVQQIPEVIRHSSGLSERTSVSTRRGSVGHGKAMDGGRKGYVIDIASGGGKVHYIDEFGFEERASGSGDYGDDPVSTGTGDDISRV